MDQTRPIIVIGTGLAGYSLVREFRKLNKESPVLMISRDDGHSYSKPLLSTGFTKQKSAEQLSMGDIGKMASQLNVSIRNFCEVTHIDPENKQISIGSEVLAYSKLVLANGASVNKLSFPGSELQNILSINDLMDYRLFREKLAGKKHVLIMGAGLIGCEYANDLLNGEYQVSLADPSSTALNGLIPDFAGDAVVKGLENAGAKFYLKQYVEGVVEDQNGLCATLNNGTIINCDLIISAVGLKPELTLAHSAKLECDKGILTNAFLETSQKDIFALGDCAQIDGFVRLYVLPLMASARALAKTLNDEKTPVQFGIMPIATKTPACSVIVCPPTSTEGEWRIDQEGLNISAKFLNLDQKILGFVLTGERVKDKQTIVKEMMA